MLTSLQNLFLQEEIRHFITLFKISQERRQSRCFNLINGNSLLIEEDLKSVNFLLASRF